jgi:hypothetical protein
MKICGDSANQYGEPEKPIMSFLPKSGINNRFFENVS